MEARTSSHNREKPPQGRTDRGQTGPYSTLRRPCDICRRRKSRCEGSQIPGRKCSNCLDGNLECTYLDPARKRESKNRHVTNLELRLEHSEALILQLRTEMARLREELAIAQAQPKNSASLAIDGNNGNIHSTVAGSNSKPTFGEDAEQKYDGRSAALQILRAGLQTVSDPPHPDELLDAELQRKMDALTMNPASGFMGHGFMGKSSGAVLFKAAVDLKTDVSREEQYVDGDEEEGEEEAWTWMARRPEYWTFRPSSTPGAHQTMQTHTYSLPPPDLVAHLVELYFSHAHIYLPVLHRSTFDRSVEMGLHCLDDEFAKILLLVCAIGSRWSHDPRVISSAGDGKGKTHLDCGWQWFNQVTPSENHLLGPATLCDVQYCCLAVHFLLGSASPQACWILVGIGLRLAQDAGAHRRSVLMEQPSVERELWKRAFWVLVYLDRHLSSLTGRTCALQYDDFNVDPLIEVDDEHWQDTSHPFQQPPGVPSRIAFFNALLRLSHLMAFTLKMLYSLGKFRVMFTVGAGWEEDFVADLDSALNRWREQVPEHLLWDPERTDPVFFDQSVALYCGYCNLQILVHRSFIPTVRKAPPTGFPSMAVCTSAARACANMLDVQRRRKGNEPVNFNMSDAFSSALVLLLNVWSSKRTELVSELNRDLGNVHKCMEVLRLCEERWPNAGMLWDVLAELASVGQLPIQSAGILPGHGFGAQQHAMASDASQPISADEILRMMFKSPTLQNPSPYSESQYAVPYAAAQYDSGGGEIPPLDTDVSTASTWLASESPFPMDPVPDPAAVIDADIISAWMNAPTGFELDDWGTYFSNVVEFN
ncbi:fungal-specific transcription factor domain-containing protein [Mycena epipterygia]|nr:fungal-specific transcription factor domain-containing protein [Mycena epipterygia]